MDDTAAGASPRIPWEQLSGDPRREDRAALRASDRDRDVALTALGQAFADGRLDATELEERTTAVQGAKRLGELLAPLRDLAVDRPVPVATDRVLEHRSDHPGSGVVWTFLLPSLVCWTIWLLTAFGPHGFEPSFPWPVFVMLGTGLCGGGLLSRRRDAAATVRRR